MAPPQATDLEAGVGSRLRGCHGNRPLFFFFPLPLPQASLEAPGGRHGFAAGVASVGGMTGLLSSCLRYQGLRQVGRLGLIILIPEISLWVSITHPRTACESPHLVS